MGFFGPKKNSYLGIDLGAGGVKLVELQNEKGRARLFTYGFTERTVQAQTTPFIEDPQRAAELLKKIAAKARVSTQRAVAGLPISSVFNAVITVPKGNEREIRDAVQWQAKKLIPIPVEEMALDFKTIAPATAVPTKSTAAPSKSKDDTKEAIVDAKKEDKNVQVLITGAKKVEVQKYVNVFKQAGLELISLETEAFALIRSLIGKDRATTMIVDIGAVRTNIIIVERGVPFVTRSIDMGGISLTNAMSKTLSMDVEEAEHMKCDIKGLQTLYPDEGLPKIFEGTIGPMLTELQYSMNLYAGQAGEETPIKVIEKIILTGGATAIPALATYLSKHLNMRVYSGDPWARIVYPDDLRPVLDEIGPRFAVGVGLAMRDIE